MYLHSNPAIPFLVWTSLIHFCVIIFFFNSGAISHATAQLIEVTLPQNNNSNSITLGQSASFSGGAWEPGHQFNAGLLAAFWEANANGGVQGGKTIFLKMYDDQYDVNKIEPNFNALLAVPDMYIFVSLMGSPTTSKALPLLEQHKMPVVGPLTGSAVFRKTFNPYTINVRAGYDDEALTMVKLFVTQKQYKRISVIFQADAFGAPAKDAIVQALTNMNMVAVGIHAYNKVDIPTTNYVAYAATVWANRPQGVILYTVEGFANPFLSEFFKIQTYKVDFITGSWIGDGNRNYLKANSLDPTHFYQTQVVPHPLGTLNITKRYRAAMVARQGANASFDFLSLEGYIVGRMVVETLKRTPTLNRADFLDAVYRTKLFEFEELLAGPFNRDCAHDPGTAKGRSSLCYCNQGMRFVSTTVVTAGTYEFVEAYNDMQYPITECFATTDVVKSPRLLATMFANTTDPQLRNVADLMAVGVASINTEVGIVTRHVPVLPLPGAAAAPLAGPAIPTAAQVAAAYGNASASALHKLGSESLLVGGIGLMHLADQDVYPIFPAFTPVPTLAVDSTTLFVRTRIHIMPTLQKELLTVAQWIATNRSGLPVDFLRYEGVDAALDDVVWKSLASHDVPLAGTGVYGSAASFATYLSDNVPNGQARNLIIAGLPTQAHGAALLDKLDANPLLHVYLCFSDAVLQWSAIRARYAALGNFSSAASLQRIYFATNFPLWTSGSTSKLVEKYLAAAALVSSIAAANLADHPAVFAGYFLSRIVQFILQRSSGDATPQTFLTELYRTSVVATDDVTIGPFVDTQCTDASEDCLCNLGPRTIFVHAVADILAPNTVPAPRLTQRFGKCRVSYNLKTTAPASKVPMIATAAAVPTVGVILLLIALRFFLRYRKVRFAPKEDAGKFFTMFVVLKKESLLWERFPEALPHVLKRYEDIVAGACGRNCCFLAKKIGCSFMITTMASEHALCCAAECSRLLQHEPWGVILDTFDPVDSDGGISGPVLIRRSRRSDVSSVRQARSRAHTRHESSSDSSSKYSRYSRYSSRSAATSHTNTRGADGAAGEDVTIEFSVGVHWDRGQVVYNAEQHAYEYSGPSVDRAAIAADKARGDQILVSSVVPVMPPYDESQFIDFCEAPFVAGGTTTNAILKQFNQPGMAWREFSAEDTPGDVANIDSIAAALEQQSFGVTMKKVTVLSIYLHQLERKATELPRDLFAKYYDDKVDDIQDIVKEGKGHVHSFVGPRLIISFNAASPTPQAASRAFEVFEAIRELEAVSGGTVSAGIAAENTLVGRFKQVHIIAGRVPETATTLQRLCTDYRGVRCLVLSHQADEYSHFALCEYVDIIRYPFPTAFVGPATSPSDSAANLLKDLPCMEDTAQQQRPRGLVCLHGYRSSDGNCDEWMYELQGNANKSIYHACNEVYERLLGGAVATDVIIEHFEALQRDPPKAAQEVDDGLGLTADSALSSDADATPPTANAAPAPFHVGRESMRNILNHVKAAMVAGGGAKEALTAALRSPQQRGNITPLPAAVSMSGVCDASKESNALNTVVPFALERTSSITQANHSGTHPDGSPHARTGKGHARRSGGPKLLEVGVDQYLQKTQRTIV